MKGRSNEYLNSKLKLKGTIIKGVGGLYYVMIDSDNDSIDTLASSEVQGVSDNIQDPAQPMPSVITPTQTPSFNAEHAGFSVKTVLCQPLETAS